MALDPERARDSSVSAFVESMSWRPPNSVLPSPFPGAAFLAFLAGAAAFFFAGALAFFAGAAAFFLKRAFTLTTAIVTSMPSSLPLVRSFFPSLCLSPAPSPVPFRRNLLRLSPIFCLCARLRFVWINDTRASIK